MKTENRLIAEFMGAVQVYKPYVNTDDMEYDMYGVIPTIEDGENEKHYFLPQEMLFDTDWNWLMEVVEKIEDFFEINGKELEFQIVSYEDEVKVIAKHSDKEWETIVEISSDGMGKKENIYNACVEFIKWFEEFKK